MNDRIADCRVRSFGTQYLEKWVTCKQKSILFIATFLYSGKLYWTILQKISFKLECALSETGSKVRVIVHRVWFIRKFIDYCLSVSYGKWSCEPIPCPFLLAANFYILLSFVRFFFITLLFSYLLTRNHYHSNLHMISLWFRLVFTSHPSSAVITTA